MVVFVVVSGGVVYKGRLSTDLLRGRVEQHDAVLVPSYDAHSYAAYTHMLVLSSL